MFTLTGSPGQARKRHEAALLPDGKRAVDLELPSA